MKKRILLFSVVLCIGILCGIIIQMKISNIKLETRQSQDILENESSKNSSAKYSQNYEASLYEVYSGFIPYRFNANEQENTPPENTITLFENEKDWLVFKQQYLKNVDLPEYDFDDRNLIVFYTQPANQRYTSDNYIFRYEKKGKQLNITLDKTGIIKKSTGTYYYCYVMIMSVDKGTASKGTIININSINIYNK